MAGWLTIFRRIVWLFTLMLTGCHSGASGPQRDPHILVRLAEDEAKGLDPQATSDIASMRIEVDQFEGLTRFNADGQAELGLASQWSQSSDGLTWKFSLLPNLRFSDGTPITAQNFVAIFNRLRDPTTASPVVSLFEAIDTVRAPASNLVVVTLRHPFPALPELMAQPALSAIPLHVKDWTRARPMITSGAYRVITWSMGDALKMEANPHWHGGTPPFRAVEWRTVSDSLTALRIFQSGGADSVGDIPSARLKKLKAEMPNAVHIAPFRGIYYYAFNNRQPPFNDIRVRRALSLVVDRDWIAKQLIATGVTPAWGIIPPGMSRLPAYRPTWADWPRESRMAEAKALLSSAGYGPAHPLTFDIRFNSDVDHRRIAVVMAAMWKPLGVEAKLLNSEAALHFAAMRRGEFDVARAGWIGDLSVPENFLAIHRSDGGGVNYSGFANPAFDQAMDHALTLSDPKTRAAAMRRAEAVMMGQSPILPIYYYISKSLVSERIKGWRDNDANIHPSYSLRTN